MTPWWRKDPTHQRNPVNRPRLLPRSQWAAWSTVTPLLTPRGGALTQPIPLPPMLGTLRTTPDPVRHDPTLSHAAPLHLHRRDMEFFWRCVLRRPLRLQPYLRIALKTFAPSSGPALPPLPQSFSRRPTRLPLLRMRTNLLPWLTHPERDAQQRVPNRFRGVSNLRIWPVDWQWHHTQDGPTNVETNW